MEGHLWSFVCPNKRGESASLCTEKDFWFIELQNLPSLHHHHQICIQDGVHSMLQS